MRQGFDRGDRGTVGSQQTYCRRSVGLQQACYRDAAGVQ